GRERSRGGRPPRPAGRRAHPRGDRGAAPRGGRDAPRRDRAALGSGRAAGGPRRRRARGAAAHGCRRAGTAPRRSRRADSPGPGTEGGMIPAAVTLGLLLTWVLAPPRRPSAGPARPARTRRAPAAALDMARLVEQLSSVIASGASI